MNPSKFVNVFRHFYVKLKLHSHYERHVIPIYLAHETVHNKTTTLSIVNCISVSSVHPRGYTIQSTVTGMMVTLTRMMVGIATLGLFSADIVDAASANADDIPCLSAISLVCCTSKLLSWCGTVVLREVVPIIHKWSEFTTHLSLVW